MRISLTGENVRLTVSSFDTVATAKLKLAEQENFSNDFRQRWYFGGKLLGEIIRQDPRHSSGTSKLSKHIIFISYMSTS